MLILSLRKDWVSFVLANPNDKRFMQYASELWSCCLHLCLPFTIIVLDIAVLKMNFKKGAQFKAAKALGK